MVQELKCVTDLHSRSNPVEQIVAICQGLFDPSSPGIVSEAFVVQGSPACID